MKKIRISCILLACIIFIQCGTNVFAADIMEEQIRGVVSGNTVSGLYDLTLEAKENIKTVVDNIDLGIDADVLLNQAQELYDKYGDEIPEEPEKAFYEYAVDLLKEFFSNIINFIVKFFTGLFS